MNTHLAVFPRFAKVRGFFTYKTAAVNGSPFDNPGFLRQLGLGDAQVIWPQQVHKDTIAVIRERGGAPLRIPETDGLVTDAPGVLLTTVHADCLPVYFYDPEREAIGLVHSGWRGTDLGIAPKCVRTMEEEYGSDPADLHAFIGPGICKDCFETGPEVRAQFLEHWPYIDEFAEPRGEKFYLDLKGIVRRQLTDAGLEPDNIEVTGHCTYHEPELFCSYRREGGTYMRMGAGLCLKEEI